ncbi:MAG: alanine:cation symporter family protein [Spirochaetes bacterium]|nr:alanine:cation symporter family protein [Spirochaetota bacterium]
MYEVLQQFSYTVRDVGFFLWTWVFGLALVGGGIWFSIRTKFVQFTLIGDAIKILSGKSAGKTKGEGDGAAKPKTAFSAFQAFCISECSRVGTGNVVGTVVAITTGGAGSIFWMWAMALFGAATNFVESTLGQLHKENAGDRFLGGPMYYFQKAFKKTKVPSFIVATIIAITYGFVFNSIQMNTIADNLALFLPHRIISGIVIAGLIGFIIFGGAKRIARIATMLLPPMVIIFLTVCFAVIVLNFPLFLQTMGYIVVSAFGTTQVAGGALGFTIAQAFQVGLRRGLFSNEAGIGTVPIAASASDVSHPVKQGCVQSFGVFLDTLLICSATAFLVLMSGLHTGGTTGVILTREAMVYWLGPVGMPFITLMLLLLPFTSLIGNYFYGESCVRFVSKNPATITVYRVGCVLLIVFASLMPLQLVWNVADIFTGTLVTFNVIAMFMLCNVVVKCLDNYREQRKAFKAGTGSDPTFYDDMIGTDTAYWKRNR